MGEAGRGEAAIVVSVAVGGAELAEAIARRLIERRLAACVQAHAITSTYRWQGAVERGEEIMLTIKTRAALFPALREQVLALHDYEVPEIVALPVVEGLGAYLDWIMAETEG